jgi:hypothetical protein
VTPPLVALSLSTFAPSVTAGGGGGPVTVVPPTSALVLTGYAPTVTAIAEMPKTTGGGRFSMSAWMGRLAAWRKRTQDEEEEEERKRLERQRELDRLKAEARRARERAKERARSGELEFVACMAVLEEDDE